MPLEEDPSGSAPQMYDWVSETNVGTSGGSMTSGDLIAGQVGNAIDFDGSDDYIATNAPYAFDYDDPFTIEFWLEQATNGAYQCYFGNLNTGAGFRGWEVGRESSSNGFYLQLFLINSYPAAIQQHIAVVSDDTRIRAVITYDGSGSASGVQGYVDGVQQSKPSPTIDALASGTTVSAANARLGARSDASVPADVTLDEAFISSVARSADWIEYAYEDDANNADTFTLGPEEVDGAPAGHFGRLVNSRRLKSKIGGGLAA
jgi:hypothetical protein